MPGIDPLVLGKIKGEILAAASRRSQALADVIRFEQALADAQARVDHEEGSVQVGRTFLMQLGLDPDAVLSGS